MINRDDFFTAKANGSLWDVAVSIKRGNPLPLDADSIFESYSALETYAAGVLAYPGQIVAVVEADSTSIYYIDQAGAIQPVGMAPTGDSKSIEVTEEGMISLLGAATAQNGTLPMIEDGALVWKTLEDIGAGDGNDNTTYEFDFANEKITITPKFNGVAQEPAVELDLSTFVTADELATELAKLTDTTYSVAEGDKVLKMTDTVLSTEIGLKHENGMVSLTGINGEVIAEFSDADFVKDSVLEDVAYDADSKKIIFTWKTEGDTTKTDEVDVADFVQVYTAGVGLNLEGNQFAVKLASGSETFLTVNADGLKLDGVQSAIDSAKQAAIDDAASKYATTTAVNELETALDSRLDALEAIDHTLYAEKTALDEVKVTADNASAKVETLEDKIDEITSVGGEPNTINYIKVNGAIQTITDKTVDIAVPTALSGLEGWNTLDERVAAAKTQADAGVEAASQAQAAADNNTTEIGKHETRIAGLETAKNEQANKIAALEQADATHSGEYTTLKNIVDEHATTIATKADQTAVDGVLTRVAANETAISTLNSITIPNLNTEIGKKANSADVYTKTEIGVLAEGKTVVQMIADAQSAATYDDSAIRALLTNETDRATAAEGVLSGRIAKAETFLNEANLDAEDGSNNVIDTLKEIQEYIVSDQTGASNMLSSINVNTAAINAINSATDGILVQAKNYVDSKIDAIPVATEGVLGLIKYDDITIKKNSSNQLYVGQISTDVLVNGVNTLVLSGGTAND